MRSLLTVAALMLAAPAYAQDQINRDPVGGAFLPDPHLGAERSIDNDPQDPVGAAAKIHHGRDDDAISLRGSNFIWTPEAAPAGFVRILVSLSKQRLYVYRGSIRIGMSAVSTGKRGYETPTGVFSILHKRRMHRSNLYGNAPMPYMQRLTWDGVALHAGHVSGSGRASHGCVRLPYAFAKLLFGATFPGALVVIED